MGDLELSNDNGWHEWGKHVLKELERLNKGQDRIERDNKEAHKGIYEKLDEQRQADETRLINCNRTFLSSKTFYWLMGGLITVLLVVCGGLGAMSITNKSDITKIKTQYETVIEQPAQPLDLSEENENFNIRR